MDELDQKIGAMDEVTAKQNLKQAFQNLDNANQKADAFEAQIKREAAEAEKYKAEAEKKTAGLEDSLKKTTDDLNKKINFLQENPTTVVSKAEFVNCPESVAKKWAEKLEAEKLLIEYQKGGWAKASHVADQVAWPIIKEQGAIFVSELRKKRYKTKIEQQNEEIGKLNKKNAKKQFKINQEDLAAKRAAAAYNKRSQDGLELLQDAQTLGQMLVNLDTICKTVNGSEKRTAPMMSQVLDIQESQLKALHARTMNQKPIPPTKPAPAPKDKKNKE